MKEAHKSVTLDTRIGIKRTRDHLRVHELWHLESAIFNLRDRCTCATPTFKPTQIGLLLWQKPLYTHETIDINA